ncbi:MAG: LamG-like jellyroll fold domain-containing protein [Planctomycetota bacterium]
MKRALLAIPAALLFCATASVAQDADLHWVFDSSHITGVSGLRSGGSVQTRDKRAEAKILGHPARICSAPQALVLDGKTNSVLVAENPQARVLPAKDMTVSAWVYIDRITDWGGIVSAIQDNGDFERGWLLGTKGNRFVFGLTSRSKRRLTYLSASSAFGVSEWHHVVGTYDGTTQRIYVDGKLSAESKEQSGPIEYPEQLFYEIGAYHDKDEYYRLSGAINEASVSTKVLGADKIKEGYLAKVDGISRQSQTTTPISFVAPEDSKNTPLPSTALSRPSQFSARERGGGQRLTVELSLSIDDVDTPNDWFRARGDAETDSARVWTADGRVHFKVGYEGKALVSNRKIASAKWHTIACVHDGICTRILIDGEDAGHTNAPSRATHLENNSMVHVGTRALSRVEDPSVRARLHSCRVSSFARPLDELRREAQRLAKLYPPPLELEYGPIAEYVSPNRVRVSWKAKSEGTTSLVYGTGGEESRRVESSSNSLEHVVYLDDITPDQMYRMTIRGLSPSHRVETSTTPYRWDSALNYRLPQVSVATQRGTGSTLASALVADSKIDRGYGLVLGAADWDSGASVENTTSFVASLVASTQLKWIILERDSTRVRKLRQSLDDLGIYGLRVSVHHRSDGPLPYTDYLFNIVVATPYSLRRDSAKDVLKILRPCGGKLYIVRDATTDRAKCAEWFTAAKLEPFNETNARLGNAEGSLLSYTRPKLPGAGEWSHAYGNADNSACSQDERVKGEIEVLWWGRPGPRPMPDRGARNPPPLSVNGRLFIQGDRTLFGLDAYNGTILWDFQMPAVRRSNVPRDACNMVATDDALYLVDRNHCLEIDAQTGERRHAFDLPKSPDKNAETLDWGYLGVTGDLLIGSSVPEGSSYVGDDGEWYDGAATEEISKVASHDLFAIDLATRKVTWVYRKGVVINPTVASDGKRIYFVESRLPAAQKGGRVHKELGKEHMLVALDAKTGAMLWEKEYDFSQCQRVMYLSTGDDTIAVVGSSDRYHLWSIRASDGSLIWQKEHAWERDHHGGTVQHPVIVNNVIYAATKAYDLKSGQLIRSDLPSRRGCGTMAASKTNFFYRHYFQGMWDTVSNKRVEFRGIRSGCWLGIVPANGIVLAPETSSGCYCTHAIQISVAYKPKD